MCEIALSCCTCTFDYSCKFEIGISGLFAESISDQNGQGLKETIENAEMVVFVNASYLCLVQL